MCAKKKEVTLKKNQIIYILQTVSYILSLAEVGMNHLQDVWVVKFPENLEFSVFVALVLKNLFNSHYLTGFLYFCFINHSESA